MRIYIHMHFESGLMASSFKCFHCLQSSNCISLLIGPGISDLRELTQLYKQRATEKVGTQLKSKKESKTMIVREIITLRYLFHFYWLMQVTLGGMIYDPGLKRGVRKRFLPEPNPTKVELSRETTWKELCCRACELFFSELLPNEDDLLLVDSNGVAINVACPQSWILGEYYHSNGFQPSRHKLYVAAKIPSDVSNFVSKFIRDRK